ncbi:MAG: hypothetical protein Q9N34_03765 [Aquificota bacterium]|nr:hypothetical protein [Aquificota bacterium]
MSAEDIEKAVRELEEEGLRVALHAIGDGAVEECLRSLLGEGGAMVKYLTG